MRTLLTLLITIILLSTMACSIAGKSIKYEPQMAEKWQPVSNARYPIAEFICSDASFHIYPAHVGEIIYSLGPPFIPIIPTFGLFDTRPGEKSFSILVVTERTPDNPNLERNSLSLSVNKNSSLNAVKIQDIHCDQSMENAQWRCVYYFVFQTSLDKIESFDISLNQPFNKCNVPMISYSRKDHGYYYPFIIPFSNYLFQ